MPLTFSKGVNVTAASAKDFLNRMYMRLIWPVDLIVPGIMLSLLRWPVNALNLKTFIPIEFYKLNTGKLNMIAWEWGVLHNVGIFSFAVLRMGNDLPQHQYY